MMRLFYFLLIAGFILLAGCQKEVSDTKREDDPKLIADINELPVDLARPLLALLNTRANTVPMDSIISWTMALKKTGSSELAGQVLTILLAENHPVYRERGSREAKRLRAYLMATLGDTGTPPAATPYLLAELRYYHPRDLRTIAAAVRASGGLPYLDSTLVVSLTPYLREDFPDEELDLDEYAPEYPYARPTSLKREILQLLATTPLDGRHALPALTLAQQPGPGSIYDRYPDMQETAKLAAGQIRADSLTFYPDLSQLFAPDGYAPEARTARTWPTWAIVDQYNRPFSFSQLKGKPFALTFYYSSCRNYNKCSMTATRFRQLEREVIAAGLKEKVMLCALSLDPGYDVPERNLEYFTTRGRAAPAPFARILTANEALLPDLLRDLDVGVSYGGGEVALHGIELLLFDRKGRLAHRYRNVHWENDQVVKDLRNLTNEGSSLFSTQAFVWARSQVH